MDTAYVIVLDTVLYLEKFKKLVSNYLYAYMFSVVKSYHGNP